MLYRGEGPSFKCESNTVAFIWGTICDCKNIPKLNIGPLLKPSASSLDGIHIFSYSVFMILYIFNTEYEMIIHLSS